MKPSPWSAAEVETLHKLAYQGVTDEAIALHLTRTRRAVCLQRRVHGIKQATVGRIENEQTWEPMPGMLKRRCERCHFWFATPTARQRGRCPDCRGMEE